MAQPTKSFHNTYDIEARPYQSSIDGHAWNAINNYVTYRNRSVEYQFFPHFHPYVPPLIRRLNEGGFSELQDADTLYLPQPNTGQRLAVRRHSRHAP